MGRSASRFQSYGYELKCKEIAACSWRQFVRLRYEIGPDPNVIESLHLRIREEESYPIALRPIPHEIEAAGQRIIFEDLWNDLIGDDQQGSDQDP